MTKPLNNYSSCRRTSRLRRCCETTILLFLTVIVVQVFSITSPIPFPRGFFPSWRSNNTNLSETRTVTTQTCIYPTVTLITPDISRCNGASGLYGSIVRTVIAELVPPGSVCVNFMYIDKHISVETMYRWEAKSNLFAHINGCRELINEKMNALVPVSWYPLANLSLPPWTAPNRLDWIIAMNKLQLSAFDRFERFFMLDLDIVILRELTKIFDETPLSYDVVGGMDGWGGCRDRYGINSGAVLMKGSRYFHSAAMQMLEDQNASCQTGRWGLVDQEVLNCMCGLAGKRAYRPEFKCSLLPVYSHIAPYGYKCRDARVRPLRLVHFVGVSKPWQGEVDRTKGPERAFWWCIKYAMSKLIADLMLCEPFSHEFHPSV